MESFLLGGENGVKEEEQKAEETIKPSMTRLSFIKLLETGPKIAPFCLYSGVSVCACGTVVAWGCWQIRLRDLGEWLSWPRPHKFNVHFGDRGFMLLFLCLFALKANHGAQLSPTKTLFLITLR